MTKHERTTRDLLPLFYEYEESFTCLEHLLLAENKKYNLTRITDPQQIRLRHYLDSLIALPTLESLVGDQDDFRCIDIGSGAGFPVLPLAIVRSDWMFVSVESTGKKADFQRKVCRELGLSNVQVISGRAEELAHGSMYREQFDAALIRAVAGLSVLVELTLGFVKVGGSLLAWKSPSVTGKMQSAQNAFHQMGAPEVSYIAYRLEDRGPREAILLDLVVATKRSSTPETLPRRFSQIKKRPL